MNAPQLNLVVIRSADIDKAVVFYQAMGLQFCKHAHGTGPEHYACEMDGRVFEIYPVSEMSTTTESVRIGFSVYSVDSVVGELQAIGATVISAPKDSPWGRRAVVTDFDGHKVEITSGLEA